MEVFLLPELFAAVPLTRYFCGVEIMADNKLLLFLLCDWTFVFVAVTEAKCLFEFKVECKELGYWLALLPEAPSPVFVKFR